MTTTATRNHTKRPSNRRHRHTSNGHTDGLRENINEIGVNFRDAVSNAVPAAKEQINRLSENVVGQSQSFEKTLESFILQKPMKSLLVAAGVGLLAGLIVRRR